MQSDRNSYCGDVVTDSFNKEYREKNMKSKYFGICNKRFKISEVIVEHAHCTYIINTAHNKKELSNFSVVLACIFV